ncbi:MAG: hypothetical protein AB2693_31480, partial [Candidatus Thiodiazotropha sp.]
NVYVCVFFPIGFESGVWELSVSIPDVCLISYFYLLTDNFKIKSDGTSSISQEYIKIAVYQTLFT